MATGTERRPGKRIGGSVYLHRSAIAGSEQAEAVELAAKKLPDGFAWHVAKVNEQSGAVTFVTSPDFDTADEPTVGDAIRVTQAGEVVAQAGAADPWIYHHKWQMVREDYAGFNVAESRARSAAWEELEGVDRSRIGKRSWWEQHVTARLEAKGATTMPVTVKQEGDVFRVVDAESGELERNAAGTAVDGGGHEAEGDALAQARAINSRKGVRAEFVEALRLGLPGFLTSSTPEEVAGLGVVIRTGEPVGPFPGLTACPVAVLELLPTAELKRLENQRHLFWVPIGVEGAEAIAAAELTTGEAAGHTHTYEAGADVTNVTAGHAHDLEPGAELTSETDGHTHPRDPAEASAREEAAPITDDERRELMLLSGANTAKARDSASKPMRFYGEAGLLVGEVLDFGCGKDPHDFARYDPAHHPDPAALNKQWDTVTCNYVLNVLPLEGLRTNVMLSLRSLVRADGHALVSVWQRSPEAETFRTSRGYQCGWSKEEWTAFLGKFWTVEELKAGGEVWAWELTHPASPGKRP